MCRLFAFLANQPTRVPGSLVLNPHALLHQSCCDARQQSHSDGWGLGFHRDGQLHRFRSPLPASEDPQFRLLAQTVIAESLVAHVRQASVGTVSVQNSHPFVHGRWLFAHNGTLNGFSTSPERLHRLLPAHLRQCIEGTTDSEHAFCLFLTYLERAAGSVDVKIEPVGVAQVLVRTIRTLEELYPGQGEDTSAMNFVVTDGRLLVAARLGRSLSWLQRRGPDLALLEGPPAPQPGYHAVLVASEPTTGELWTEVPERTMLLGVPRLAPEMVPIP